MATRRRLFCLFLGLLASGPIARAQDAEPGPAAIPEARPRGAEGEARQVDRRSLAEIVSASNPMVWPLVLCSVVALGFALERAVALRRGRVLPRDFVNRFVDRLANGKLDRDRAVELCRANESPAARLFAGVVRYWGLPAVAIRQAVEADAAAELVDLRRNVRVLNGTATLAPLLGLLGTVIGMIESFEAIGTGGRAGTDRGASLAHGISLALVSTAAGLAIAIVSVVAYYFLLHRIDVLTRALDEQVRRVIDLVAAEAGRTLGAGDRRATPPAADYTRHESRTLGRSEPV